jgi:RimJ/RimL family protein N-acetyltransferase
VIELEPLAPEHLPGVEAMLDDPDIVRFTRIPVPAPRGFAQAWLERYEQARRDGTREAFAIVDDGEFLGVALAASIEPEARQCELGYMVARAARGRGVATEALHLLTDWAFGLGMLRAELHISVGNEASKRVAERNGYRLEGVLRSLWFKGDQREDSEIWSRLPSDPV